MLWPNVTHICEKKRKVLFQKASFKTYKYKNALSLSLSLYISCCCVVKQILEWTKHTHILSHNNFNFPDFGFKEECENLRMGHKYL